MSDKTDIAYRDAETAFLQAIHRKTEAEVQFVLQPSDQTEQAFRDAQGGFSSAQLALNTAQKERLISAASLAQMAQIVGEELDKKVQVLEDASARNYDMLCQILDRLSPPVEGVTP